MPIVLFLLDTSGSMNQKTSYGTSYIDIAKSAVENFIKIRSRERGSGDRYMLVTTTDEPPANIKAGWKESHQNFTQQLKSLCASGMTMLGLGLKTSFDLLNINRLSSRIDNYGMGRNPWYLEPAIIILITDGGCFTSNSNAEFELTLPLSTLPGFELTKEPYRWDQRVFSLVLDFPGFLSTEAVKQQSVCSTVPASENAAINDLCEYTGGRSYRVQSMKTLYQCVESIAQKLYFGVVLQFEVCPSEILIAHNQRVGYPHLKPDSNGVLSNGGRSPLYTEKDVFPGQKSLHLPQPPPIKWKTFRRMLFVKTNAQKVVFGHWPLPEPYFPDSAATTLPPRTAHPEVLVDPTDVDPGPIDNIPYDKYEIEPCILSSLFLDKKNPNAAWQIYIRNSGNTKNPLGYSFGFLKASSSLQTLYCYVLPYNWPALVPLIDQLVRVLQCKPSPQWCKQFDDYLKTMPAYYAPPLRIALKKVGAAHLVPEALDYFLNQSIQSYIRKLSHQTKLEGDRVAFSINQRIQQKEAANTATKQRNVFDISRDSVLSQVNKLRSNLLNVSYLNRPFHDSESKHCIPISAMGNYQEYLSKHAVPPLREVDPAPQRQHVFGNPFKVAMDKDKMMMIDEAEDFPLEEGPPVTSPNVPPGSLKRPHSSNNSFKNNFKRTRIINKVNSKPNISPNIAVNSSPASPSTQEKATIISQPAVKDVEWQRGNQLLVEQIILLIRTPCDTTHSILCRMKRLAGPTVEQRIIIRHLISQCLRFRRKSLANRCRQHLKELRLDSNHIKR